MKQYIGILLALVGALLLLVTYLTDQTEQANTLLGGGLALVVIGYLVHILLSKKSA